MSAVLVVQPIDVLIGVGVVVACLTYAAIWCVVRRDERARQRRLR